MQEIKNTVSSWVVQSNLAESPTCLLLQDACRRLDLGFHPISIEPGQLSLPDELPATPLIAHGATTLILLAAEDKRFEHGVFYDAATFNHSAYVEGYGSSYINSDADLLPWTEVRKRIEDKGEMFVKPHDDLKAFTGFVATTGLFDELQARLSRSRLGLPNRVLVARASEVDAEYRFFVVAGKIISGSMYRPWGDPVIPDDLMHFAVGALNGWTPAPVFVLDIGRVDGVWKIIECNCFNWSRFYQSNAQKVVDAVSEYQRIMLSA